MSKKKRLDGITKLSKEEAKNRDAQAQYWMNQRKIERVAEGAARHGWQRWPSVITYNLIVQGLTERDEQGRLNFIIEGDGRYVLVVEEEEMHLVRKIETFRVSTAESG